MRERQADLIPVIPIDEINRKTKMTKPARATNTMKVCLCVFGEIKIDNDVHSLDIDTAGEEI